MPKDLFSRQASTYANYRPPYPQELFDYILQFTGHRNKAWDCATGNGQAAVFLSPHFGQVEATDISEAQIRNAIQKPNIHYTVCPAEQTAFADDSFDLITVAQAYHWLNWKTFYTEATRVCRPGAVVAVWGYNLPVTDDERLNTVLKHFYIDIVGPYWDAERKFVDAAYQTVEFNFDPLPSREFSMKLSWTKEQFTGYLKSWSAVQHYIKVEGASPLDLIQNELDGTWNEEQKPIRFPIFMKIGRARK